MDFFSSHVFFYKIPQINLNNVPSLNGSELVAIKILPHVVASLSTGNLFFLSHQTASSAKHGQIQMLGYRYNF